MWIVIAIVSTLMCLSQAQIINVDQNTYMREVFTAIGEDPSLLDPLYTKLGLENTASFENLANDNSSICLGCMSAVTAGNEFINLPGPGYPLWRLTIITTCKSVLNGIGVDGDLVCAGLCDNYGPHVFDIFRARDIGSRETCEYMNICDRPEVFDPPATIQKPTLVSRDVKQPIPQNAVKVAFVTDVHVEHRYTVGAPTRCNIWVCCRDDVMGQGAARQWGEYTCNTAPHTLELFLDRVAEMAPHAVMYGGDGPPHSMFDETQEKQLNMTSWIAQTFTERFPGINVFPTLGNHDGFPANLYYAPREDTVEQNIRYGEDWAAAAGWGPEELETIHYSGYYTKEIVPGLRLLAYNSNYGYTQDWYNLLSMYEEILPTMRQWMVATLEAARTNGEKVIMFGHHPLGGSDNIVEDGVYMSQLFIDYSDVITFQPTGHTHQAQIRLVIDDEGVARNMIYVTGSLTTYTNANPTVTMFYLDPVTFQVLEYEHYYNNIDEQNEEIEPTLDLMYRATEEYGLADLSPASWLDLTYRMEEDDVLFQSYLDNRNSRVNPGGSVCDGFCKHSIICGMRSVDYTSYRRCQNTYE